MPGRPVSALGVRTAFNLLGPLTNPAGAARQLVGVPRPEFTELIARSLLLLGSKRAWVVHGSDGIDEISTTGYTKVSECRDGSVNTFYLHPADVGLPKATQAAIRGGTAADNARIIRSVLAGERGPARDIVVLNAGAALFIAGRGRRRCGTAWRAPPTAIDRGAAAETLQRMVVAVDGRGIGRGGGRMTSRRPPISSPRSSRQRAGSWRCAPSASRSPRLRGARCALRAAARCVPRGARRAGRVNVIAECKRRSPSRGVLRADYDCGLDRARLCSGGRRGDFRADRTDLLRRFARAPAGGACARCRRRCCARTSSCRSTSCSRRGRQARMRRC